MSVDLRGYEDEFAQLKTDLAAAQAAHASLKSASDTAFAELLSVTESFHQLVRGRSSVSHSDNRELAVRELAMHLRSAFSEVGGQMIVLCGGRMDGCLFVVCRCAHRLIILFIRRSRQRHARCASWWKSCKRNAVHWPPRIAAWQRRAPATPRQPKLRLVNPATHFLALLRSLHRSTLSIF